MHYVDNVTDLHSLVNVFGGTLLDQALTGQHKQQNMGQKTDLELITCSSITSS